MNNNNHHSDKHELAKQTVESLEALSAAEAGDDDVFRLGAALRQASAAHLPPANKSTLDRVIKELDNQGSVKPHSIGDSPGVSRFKFWAIAATALIGLGVWGTLQFEGQRQFSMVVDSTNNSAQSTMLPPSTEIPPSVVYEQEKQIMDQEMGGIHLIEEDPKVDSNFFVDEPAITNQRHQKYFDGEKGLGFRKANNTGKNLFETKDISATKRAPGGGGYSKSRELSQRIARMEEELKVQNGKQFDTEMRIREKLDELKADFRKTENMANRNGSEQYESLNENPFIRTQGAAAVSTFSIDVDTASYANVRRFLNNGQLPNPHAVRIEEMVNYFNYDYPQPENDDPFSVNMEVASCPWNRDHQLLRIGLQGRDLQTDQRPASNIVFLLDVSGSMNAKDKLPLLKNGFRMLTRKLTENDRVSIVTYAGKAGVVLEPTSGNEKAKILNAIDSLTPGGSTNGSAGIERAYEIAQNNFIQDGTNRVILATDGDLNVGVTSDSDLVRLITNKASEGVFLTVLGFGTGNLKDAKLEKLADNGNGMYAYIDGQREARKVLVDQLAGSLVTIAKDVKLQIEFNPNHVKAYRLIGYENRVLATRDFNDDLKDAGEIGAGHSVTALYELITTMPANPKGNFAAPVNLKYQEQGKKSPPVEAQQKDEGLTDAAKSNELLTLSLRFKQPTENQSTKRTFALTQDDQSFENASDDFRFAASVASFGMLLRGSSYAGSSNAVLVEQIAKRALGEDENGFRQEFVDLVRCAKSLGR